MLFALKLILSLLIINQTQAHACPETPDLSWVDRLNHQASNLSETTQQEARAIVNHALHQGLNRKSCTVAQDIVQQGEDNLRQTLITNERHQGLLHAPSKGNDFVYPNLLVFVSFSMPDTSLKALHAQVKRLRGKLVLRGLINGSFRETAQKLKELQIEMIIDPTLFEAYQMPYGVPGQSQVLLDHVRIKPATKVTNFAPAQRVGPMFVLRNEPTNKAEEHVVYDRLTGNVSLEYVLEQFANTGETRSLALDLLKTLRGLQ